MAQSGIRCAAAHIDLGYLEFSSFGRNELVVRAIDILLDQLPEQVADLNRALLDRNWSGVRLTAHSLKSAAGMLGMEETRQALRQIESGAEAEALDDRRLGRLIGEVSRACAQAAATLSAVRWRYATPA